MTTFLMVPLRRISLRFSVQSSIPLWAVALIALGLVLSMTHSLFSGVWKEVAVIFAIVAGVVAVGNVIWTVASRTGEPNLARAKCHLGLMDNGIDNPKRHLKNHPELVKAHEEFTKELGMSPEAPINIHLTRDIGLYKVSLLVLSGKVAAEDSHLIHDALDRGMVDPTEVYETVTAMKSHGNAVASGVL